MKIRSALFFLLMLAVVYVALKRFAARPPDAAAVITQIQKLNELVTVRYSIQRVVGMTEAKVPFGSESILLMVQGEAKAGVDLGKLSARNVETAPDGTLVITLPPPVMTDVYLDEKQIKVWDRSVTWWTPWVPFNPDLEHKARLQAIEDVRKAALQMGILGQAQRNAESGIRDLLMALHLNVSYRSGD